MKPFKGAIFDLDGTLLDSLGMWKEIDREFLEKRGVPCPPDYQHAVKGMNFSEAADYTIARFALNESPAAVMAEWLDMTRAYYARTVELKPFAREYLLRLSEQNIPLAVATSSKRELFMPALERFDIAKYFTAIVTTEDVGRGKGFPDIYRKAAEELGVAHKDCAVFEDVLIAVKCAHDAGFYTVAVYDEHSAHENKELVANSDFFIQSFSELL